MSKQPQDEDAALTAFLGASSNMQHDEQSESSSSASSIVDPSTSSSKDSTKPKKRGRFSLAGLMGALPGGNNSGGSAEPSLHAGDLTTADKLAGADATLANQSDPVEVALGPWRFGAADVDAIEVNSRVVVSLYIVSYHTDTAALYTRTRRSSSSTRRTSAQSLNDANISSQTAASTDAHSHTTHTSSTPLASSLHSPI